MSWSDPQIVLASIAAVATVIYTLLTAFIWHATWQNTKATREVLEAQHRPYIGIVRVELHFDNLQDSRIDVIIQNVGNVPSRRVEADLRIAIPGKTRETMATVPKNLITLFPNHLFVIASALSMEEAGFLNKHKALKVIVTIRYEGATDKKYTTNGTHAYSTENNIFAIESGDWN